MTTALLVLALFTGPALAADESAPEPLPEASASRTPASSSALCLSDGQRLSGVRIDDHGAHRTVRIGEEEIRVPADALASDCSKLIFAQQLDPDLLRTVTLADGQRLYGTPLRSASDFTLGLLDAHKIFVPNDLVVDVAPYDRAAPELESVKKAQNQGRMRKGIGIAATVGLGVLGAAAIAGTTAGIVALSNNGQQAR